MLKAFVVPAGEVRGKGFFLMSVGCVDCAECNFLFFDMIYSIVAV